MVRPPRIAFGKQTRNGTLTEVSYIFCGKVAFPLPKSPWCPMFIPLSDVKMMMVLSYNPLLLRASMIFPIPASMAVMAE